MERNWSLIKQRMGKTIKLLQHLYRFILKFISQNHIFYFSEDHWEQIQILDYQQKLMHDNLINLF